ncbi:MAG TPA: WG repeat-containing protein [Cyclobacteriaceae bacterium]|nr:WG repeat-containing protein [Cyclobacteriaceae bacterium]
MFKVALLLIFFNQALAEDLQIFYENGKAGLKNTAGIVLIPAAYESLGWSNGSTQVFEQTIGYLEQNQWGLLNLNNEILIAASYSSLQPFSTGHYKASITSKTFVLPKTGLINKEGKTLLSFIYDDLIFSNNKIIAVQKSSDGFAHGLIDFNEKQIIPIVYSNISSMGTLRYAVKNKEQKIALFNESGKKITDFEIDSISSFQYNIAIFYKNLLCGLMQRDGSILENAVYADIKINEDGSYQILQENKWKVLSADDKLLHELQADGIEGIGANRYRLSKSGHHQLQNENFQPLSDDWYTFIGDVQNNKIIFQSGNKYGLMKKDHQVVVRPTFDSLLMLNKILAGKKTTFGQLSWGLYDFEGNRIADQFYESISAYDDNFLITRNKNYYGLITLDGKEIFPTIYEGVLQIKHNKAVIKFHQQYGILDLKGNWLVGPSNHPLQIISNGYYLEKQEGTTFLKNQQGDLIYFSHNQLMDEGDYLLEIWPDGKVWKIDLSGRIFARQGDSPSLLFEAIYPPSEGFYGIKKDGRYGFVDEQNRLRIANRYDGIGSFKDGLAPVMIRNKWGFIDKYENLVIQPQFESAEDFYKGISIVMKDGKYGLLDLGGNMIIAAAYSSIKRLPNDHYLIIRNNEYGLASPKGKIIINPAFDDLNDLDNGYVIVKRNNKYGLLSTDGVSTIPAIYDQLIYDADQDRYFALHKAQWIKKDRP